LAIESKNQGILFNLDDYSIGHQVFTQVIPIRVLSYIA